MLKKLSTMQSPCTNDECAWDWSLREECLVPELVHVSFINHAIPGHLRSANFDNKTSTPGTEGIQERKVRQSTKEAAYVYSSCFMS